jgi:glycosyltransferase involved in cell wall biosynthesis
MTENFEKILEESPFKSDIILLGHVDGESHLLMGACKAFIYISKFEGFGIPILEAIRTDRPVICSNTSSMPEVAGEAAILVDPFNTDEIARAMENIVTDDALLEKLAKARPIQSKKFSWQKTSESIYTQLSRIGSN